MAGRGYFSGKERYPAKRPPSAAAVSKAARQQAINTSPGDHRLATIPLYTPMSLGAAIAIQFIFFARCQIHLCFRAQLGR